MCVQRWSRGNGWRHNGAATETPGVNSALLRLSSPRGTISHCQHPNPPLSSHVLSLVESSSSLSSLHPIEPLIFARHMLTQNKDYISQCSLWPSVVVWLISSQWDVSKVNFTFHFQVMLLKRQHRSSPPLSSSPHPRECRPDGSHPGPGRWGQDARDGRGHDSFTEHSWPYNPDVHGREINVHPVCVLYVLSHSLCLTLGDPTDCSPLGPSVHGIFQATILEWVAISFSRVSSWPRDQTCLLCLLHWQEDSLPLSSPGKPPV